MGTKRDRLVQIPEKFPKITAGTVLQDGKTLITGHSNGYIARWGFGKPKPDILLRTSSEVNAVVQSRAGGFFVGCNAGDLYYWPSPETERPNQLRPPTNTKYTRVFRIAQPLASTSLITSTYGVMTLLTQSGTNWSETQLPGHNQGVFAVAHEGDHLMATGDYRGNILIWKISPSAFEITQRLGVGTYISGLAFLGPQLLAVIDYGGQVHLFEWQPSTSTWRAVFESDTASGEGTAVAPSTDGKTVFAATTEEILQVDPDSQQIRSGKVKDTLALFPHSDHLLVLTPGGLTRIPLADLTPKLDLIQYHYFKVGLLGNTSYGKTTLCSAIVTGNPGVHLSTFGRRVWPWTVEAGPPQRRILLNDNGGQEQLVESLIPFVADSDVVFLFFKQTEIGGFRTAIQLHRKLKGELGPGAKSYLIETYTDHPLKAVSDQLIASEIAHEHLDGVFKIVPTRMDEIETFKKRFLEKLDWANARTAVQSDQAVGLAKTIEVLKQKGKTVSNVDEVRSAFEQITKSRISAHHLKFLLRNLTDSGQLEYYPRVGDSVVMDDPEFNELRTNIPIFAGEKGGILRIEEIREKFPEKPEYLRMLDRFYIANGISIPFSEEKSRVFPAFLEQRELQVAPALAIYVEGPKPATVLEFPDRDLDMSTLLRALSDMNLDCVDATKTEGLFSWDERACVYYQVLQTQSKLAGKRLSVSFKVDGHDTDAASSLDSQFGKLLMALYGEPIGNGGAGKM
jgi:GTPase SAR1 family protein